MMDHPSIRANDLVGWVKGLVREGGSERKVVARTTSSAGRLRLIDVPVAAGDHVTQGDANR